MPAGFDPNFSFNEQLWYYYSTNRGKIRSRYNDLTRKFLAYNDGEENPHAFLRKPQFEALEMYVFVKETSLDKGTQRKTTENELPSLTQCTA